MLFHVEMTVRVPHDADPDLVADLNEKEHVRARELQESGRWVHLWRVAGKFQNISVFDVASSDELHEVVSSLPLYPFMDVEVTALCHHPGAIDPS
jgi:muconolactone D-isomerase